MNIKLYGVAWIILVLIISTAISFSEEITQLFVYKIDPVHSTILAKVRHLGAGNVYGRFDAMSGSFAINSADPSKSSVSIEVNSESVDTNNPKRDQHVKSSDFLNVLQFPTLSFKSTSVKKLDEKTYEVTGNFTAHGVTKPLTVQAVVVGVGKGMKGEERLGLESIFTVNRSDFGITFMPGAVGEEVQITLEVEGIKQ